ncbi:hypothetical protein Tco_1208281 [Tanacetum coccineum]
MKSSVPYNELEKQSSCFPMPNQSQENCFNTSIRAPFLSTVHQNSSSSSYFHNTPIRPPFQTTINQNSLSLSSLPNTHVRPPFQTTINQNSLSSSSLANTYTSGSSSSLLDNERDQVNVVDEYEKKLLYEEVFCRRFMTLLLKESKLCPPDFKDWTECKTGCRVRLLLELWLRFSIPERKSVDDIIFEIMDDKFRTLKYRLKMKLFGLAANRLNELNEANNIVEDGEQEMDYTEDEILQALDLIEAPEYFMDH